VQSLAESGPTNSAATNSDKASRPAATKIPQSAVEKIGESDITEEDDWLNETPSAPSAAPATSAAAASFAPASRATLGQPAFQDEDDYDMDEEAAAPAPTAEVKQMSFPITPAPGGFTQAVPAHVADAVSAPAYPTVGIQPMLASAPAMAPAVAPTKFLQKANNTAAAGIIPVHVCVMVQSLLACTSLSAMHSCFNVRCISTCH